MATKHQWCSTHRIAFNTDLDASCPQCMLQRIQPAKTYDFSSVDQKPLDAAGKPFDARGPIPL
jgi:hypothetical protein